MQTLKISGKAPVTENIKDRIKTFEDACNELGIDSSEVSASGKIEEAFDSIAAYTKLIIIIRALNEGWKPDWDNHSEYKYYPWFNMSGSGLSFFGSVNRRSFSCVGSRLCFKSRELAEYAGKQFIDIYSKFFLI